MHLSTWYNIIKQVSPVTISIGDVDRVYEMNNVARYKHRQNIIKNQNKMYYLEGVPYVMMTGTTGPVQQVYTGQNK